MSLSLCSRAWAWLLTAALLMVPSAGGALAGECDDACCADACCQDLLLGFIAPSDHDLCNFISPMTNPVFFEDPRTLTEARFIFANHNIPARAPLVGGDVQVVAMQLRAALTERLSVIATKDGFIFAGQDAAVLDDGWADVTAGLKYNLLRDPDCQRVVSAGFWYEMPIGSHRALQGRGDGEFNVFLSGGTQLGELSHLVSTAGFRLPVDTVDDNQMFYWSAHLDRQLGCSGIYVLGEANWYHYLRDGAIGVPGVGGLDFFNLGSPGVAGNDVVTGAVGLKYKPSCCQEIGVAFEVPLTDRRDVLENRLTFDWIFRY